jgi:hypothetical protein
MPDNAKDIKMSELEGYDQIADVAAGRPLCHFSCVHSFRYFGCHEDELGDTWRDIELVIEERELPCAQVGIKFHRVADVEFSGFGHIAGLFFQSIQERGWERLRFEVGDYEEGHIHLFCHDITLFDPRIAA